jgi:hypothetical protein
MFVRIQLDLCINQDKANQSSNMILNVTVFKKVIKKSSGLCGSVTSQDLFKILSDVLENCNGSGRQIHMSRGRIFTISQMN